MSERTIVERIQLLIVDIRAHQQDPSAQVAVDGAPPAREFALAITHLEDARTRFTVGRAKQKSEYQVADLDG